MENILCVQYDDKPINAAQGNNVAYDENNTDTQIHSFGKMWSFLKFQQV